MTVQAFFYDRLQKTPTQDKRARFLYMQLINQTNEINVFGFLSRLNSYTILHLLLNVFDGVSMVHSSNKHIIIWLN